jgi:hypothetical protein
VNGDDSWFAPKRYGFGATPIKWQGWALIIGFVATMTALVLRLKGQPVQLIAALILPVSAFVVISCRTTRGGCRWRWGEEE